MEVLTNLLAQMQPTLLYLLENMEWIVWGSVLVAAIVLVRVQLGAARESLELAEGAARLRALGDGPLDAKSR